MVHYLFRPLRQSQLFRRPRAFDGRTLLSGYSNVLTVSLFAFTKQMVSISGGPSSGGKISSSNLSIRCRTFIMFGPLFLEDTQFGMPVRQCQWQAHDIGIPVAQFRFDGGDLAAASFDFHSRWYSCTLRFDLLERAAVAIESSPLIAQVLPASNNDVDVLGI